MKTTKFRIANLVILLLITMMQCTSDDLEYIEEEQGYIPTELIITEPVGIKLENIFVSDVVSMNVKLETEGEYRIKIKDISGKIVSQEKILAKQGDNILSVYTTTLDKSSYTIELQDPYGNKLGSSIFVIQ